MMFRFVALNFFRRAAVGKDLPVAARRILGIEDTFEFEVSPDIFVQSDLRTNVKNTYEVSRVRYYSTIISVKQPNNLVKLDTNEIARVKKIIVNQHSKTVDIVCVICETESVFHHLTEKCLDDDVLLDSIIHNFSDESDSIVQIISSNSSTVVTRSVRSVNCSVASVPVNSQHILAISMCHRFIHE